VCVVVDPSLLSTPTTTTTTTTKESNNMSWPPFTVSQDNAEAIINECELMELLSERGQGKQFIAVRF
jgi:hypothetical protein